LRISLLFHPRLGSAKLRRECLEIRKNRLKLYSLRANEFCRFLRISLLFPSRLGSAKLRRERFKIRKNRLKLYSLRAKIFY
jgi:hypothetical protein